MDLDSLQADLNSLRKLYGLLQINESGGQSAVSKILDEGSRLFLRKLLDGAAKRIFEAHIKNMADNWRSVLGTKSLGQPKEAKGSKMLQCVASSPIFYHNIKESVGALLQKDDQPLEMLNRVFSVTSRLRRFTSELHSRRKKRCLSCEQSNKLEETNKTLSCSANIATPKKEVEEKASKVEDFSKKIDDAIARIESLIPSLHNMAKHVPAPSSSGETGGVVTRTKQSQTRQSNQVQYSPIKHRESNDRRAHDNYMPQLNESKETSSDSSNSSSWNTVKVSSSSSPSDTTTQTSTTICSGENDSEFSSNNLDYPDADESSMTQYVTSQSSSRYDSSSHSASDCGDDDLSPSENYQSRHRSIRHKKEGKVQRLKNKLGLIFHHHHHHLHPHDKSGEPSKSVWNKVGKLFRGTDKKVEAKVGKKLKNKEKKVGPKRAASDRKGKKQIGHFHALLRGVMRHVRHTKKTKLGGQRGTKPNYLLNRVKLAHKPRMKLLARKNKKLRLRLH